MSVQSKPPVVFACSGCSSAGQLANNVALELDRRGIAEMSCLAGIGAAKQHFLKKLAGRAVWIVDGCPIECSLGVFGRIREPVDVHLRLYELGVRKADRLPEGAAFEKVMDGALEQARRQSAFPGTGETTLFSRPRGGAGALKPKKATAN